MSFLSRLISRIIIVCFFFNLTACSFFFGDEGVFRDRKKDYRKAESVDRIVVPAPLDSESIVDLYPVPALSRYSDGEMIDELPLPVGIANVQAPVKIQKMDDTQWVLLQISASQAWPRLKEFISNKKLTLVAENGAAGMVETHSDTGIYRFRIEQGFQRNSAELSVRFLDQASQSTAFWPAKSSDPAQEQVMLESLAQYFADASDKAAFSFAAQGISTKKKVDIQHDESGGKILVLMVSEKRTWVSLLQGLQLAGFTVNKKDDNQKVIDVQYTPPLDESDQPGAFKRFFGVKRKLFDNNVKYAGRYYQFLLQENATDNTQVFVKALDSHGVDEELVRKEQNYMLLLLKERLY